MSGASTSYYPAQISLLPYLSLHSSFNLILRSHTLLDTMNRQESILDTHLASQESSDLFGQEASCNFYFSLHNLLCISEVGNCLQNYVNVLYFSRRELMNLSLAGSLSVSVFVSVCLSVCLSAGLFVCLSLSFSKRQFAST